MSKYQQLTTLQEFSPSLKQEFIQFGLHLQDIYRRVMALQKTWNLLYFEAEKKFQKSLQNREMFLKI